MGFGVPIEAWLRLLKGWVDDLLDPQAVAQAGCCILGPFRRSGGAFVGAPQLAAFSLERADVQGLVSYEEGV